MKEILLFLALFGILISGFMIGWMIGQRRALRKHGIWDMRPTLLTFDNLGKAFNSIAIALSVPLRFWNDDPPTRRLPHEHPVDWVLRVGPKASGHNITRGEAWRFRELRDWWKPDNILDEYGHFYEGSTHV